MRGLEHLSSEERLRARTVQPQGKKVQEDLMPIYKHLMGQKEQKGTTLPSEVPTDRGRVNGDHLKWSSSNSIQTLTRMMNKY